MVSLHTRLTDGAYAEHVAFWARALDAFQDDFRVRQPWLSRPAARGSAATVLCSLDDADRERIGHLGRHDDLGVSAVVLAAVSVALAAATRGEQVVIETPQLADAAGSGAEPFVPVVLTADAESTVRAHLQQVAAVLADTYSFQPFPVREFAAFRSPRALPATNVCFALEGLHAATPPGPEHQLRVRVSRAPSLQIALEGVGEALPEDYLHALAALVTRAIRAYGQLDGRLTDVDLIGDDARRALLARGGTPGAAAPTDTIPALFEAQVEQNGAAEALRLDGHSTSYAELNRQANRLAHALTRNYGVTRGDVVGVLTERSPLTIVALLAVLKAGAVYLPIDPDYPEERLQFLVSDARVRALLVHAGHLEQLVSLYETPMFALDLQLETLDTPETNPGGTCAAADLAYIIYTSGSTGQPKGVLLEHGGFINMIRHHVAAFAIEPSDRFLQFYGLSFDSSLFEVFMALLSGATLVLVSREVINDPQQLSAYVATHKVTTLTLPPVYLMTLRPEHLGSVRRYISAGDHGRVEDAVSLARHAAYYNSYGPTETSVCVTHSQVDPARAYGARIPIGRPITGIAIHVLDADLRLVPDGVLGEICISGAGLARGYLNREAQTAAAFVDSPYVAGQRLYRTGDLGAWLPDGTLEVLGRKDNQVKIRGYRVELGEIEAALTAVPKVREAVVVAREDATGHRQLAAYLTSDGALEPTEVRAALQARLPGYMLPAWITVLPALPLTANGKADRRALPDPDVTVKDRHDDGPENDLQASLVRVWQEVLGRSHVGIHDNLFDLGGDSILVIQIVARAREAGLALAPHQLFDHQTIAELAAVATAAGGDEVASAEQGVVVGPAVLAPMQAWFLEQDQPEPFHFNQSICVELPGPIDAAAAQSATAALLVHHDALRTRVRLTEEGWQADIAPVPDEVPWSLVDLSLMDEGAREPAVETGIAAAQRGLRLDTGPMIRVVGFDLGPARQARVCIVAHHLVVDGVSWRILLGDFHTLYSQASRHEALVLPPKSVSFRTWTAHLAELAGQMARDRSAASERNYWRSAVAAVVAALPTDRPMSPAALEARAARSVSRAVDEATTTALLQEVPRAYSTEINDVLLTALALTWRDWTGTGSVLLDLEGHGRGEWLPELDVSRTVGWFTAQYPLRLRLAETDGLAEAIRSVKEQVRAVPSHGVGFGALRHVSEEPGLAAELAALPQPQVLFNYFGQAERGLAAGLQWRVLPRDPASDISPLTRRTHLLEINGVIAEGRLTTTWTYSGRLYDDATIERLAEVYVAHLEALVAHCRTVTTRQFTPSDCPASGLDQQALDALMARLSR